MDKEKTLMQLKDLLYNFENFESVETTEDDVQALKYAIKELERTAQEVPVQDQYVGKCNHCGYINEFSLPIGIHLPSGINPKFCMRCSRPTTYNVKKVKDAE